jgi:hypothetical protein
MKTPLLILCALLCGCEPPDNRPYINNSAAMIHTSPNNIMVIYPTTIDGCQYLAAQNVGIIHKANCTNHVSKP